MTRKIGINGNEANVPHRVGINQLAFEILKRFPSQTVVYLANPPLPDMPKLRYEVFGPKKLWTLTGLQKKILTNPPEVLFSLTHYAPLFIPCKSVILITDLGHEKMPQFYKKNDLWQLKYWSRLSASQATHIITISECSKKDIVELFKISPKKITVAYPGYDQTRFNTSVKPDKKYGDYLLFLGTLQPRKNIERLIEAFSLLRTPNYRLVITGMKDEGRGGWMNENIRASQNVILTGYLPDDEIPGLMAGAKAFVLPSLYEGFGIPAIEAMAVGCPVIVSRVSSLPEICGEAATYIEDPYSIDSIKTALEKGLKSNKTKLGLEWVKRYNWDHTCSKINTVLNSV